MTGWGFIRRLRAIRGCNIAWMPVPRQLMWRQVQIGQARKSWADEKEGALSGALLRLGVVRVTDRFSHGGGRKKKGLGRKCVLYCKLGLCENASDQDVWAGASSGVICM